MVVAVGETSFNLHFQFFEKTNILHENSAICPVIQCAAFAEGQLQNNT